MGEFWAAVIGAIVGAIAGGGIAAILQHWQYSREKGARERALAQALFFKVLRIHSDLEGYRRHVADCAAFAHAKGLREGWQSLKPIGNGPPRIAFAPEEMALLLDLRRFDLLNTVLSLDAVHGSTVDIFELYASRRAAMGALIGADRMEGQIASVDLSEEMMRHAGPLAAELDDIVTQIKARADRDAREAWEGVTGLHEALQPKLGYRLTLEPVAGTAPVAVQPTGVAE